MDPKLVALVTLRGLASLFALQGKNSVAETINSAINAYQAGKNVDDYMQLIADRLEAGDDLADWEDITGRINAEVDDFIDEPGPVDPPDEPT